MSYKKVDHELHPTQDHTKWYTDIRMKKQAVKDFGLIYVGAEADEETLQKALGPKADKASFHASNLNATTDADIKKAKKAVLQREKAEAPEPIPTWTRGGFSSLNRGWQEETEKIAEAIRQSTMQVPSTVVIPHVATGSAPKPARKSKKRAAAEDGEESASSAKKSRTTKKRQQKE